MRSLRATLNHLPAPGTFFFFFIYLAVHGLVGLPQLDEVRVHVVASHAGEGRAKRHGLTRTKGIVLDRKAPGVCLPVQHMSLFFM